jgi:uncharacterized membrane protein YeaQ/YmgE (transglycosylase-associated protein family)
MFHILGQAIVGLIIGAIAKLLLPGPDPGGIIVTALVGALGSLVGTLGGRAFWGENYKAGWVMSILGAIVLFFIYRRIVV